MKSSKQIWSDISKNDAVDFGLKKIINDFFLIDEIDYKKYYQNERANELASDGGLDSWEISNVDDTKAVNCTPTFRKHFANDTVNRGIGVPSWFYIAYPDVALWFDEKNDDPNWFQNNFKELSDVIEKNDNFFSNYENYKVLLRGLINKFKLNNGKLECSFIPTQVTNELNNKWASDIFNIIKEENIKPRNGKIIEARDFESLAELIQNKIVASQQLFEILNNKGLINRGFCPYTNETLDNTSPCYSMFNRKVYFSRLGFKKLEFESKARLDKVLGDSSTNTNSIKTPKSGCYIATVAYGNEFAPEVIALKKYRDEKLSKSFLGRIFIRIYYNLSPPIAKKLKNNQKLNNLIRIRILDTIVKIIN
jgi:hypothetical protein